MSRKAVSKRRGVTLILAVMIMSAVLAIGITLSTVLVFQVRINTVVKESHQGYYAAESGIELGLNTINDYKSSTLASAITALQGAVLPFAAADSGYTSYFNTNLLSASTQASSAAAIPATVKENQGVFIELYNVDDSLNATSGTNFSAPVLCIYAEGTQVGGSDTAGNEVLEVSWVGWGSSLEVSPPQKILVSSSKFTSTAECSSSIPGSKGFSVPLTQFYPAFSPTAFAGFRIRITPLKLVSPANGDVVNMAVYTNPAVTSQIQLKSVSNALGQKQALVALFPWSLPLSSLFDFVIFSEKTLSKTVDVSISQDLLRYGPTDVVSDGTFAIAPTTAFTDPNPDCGASNPCTYYIRLIAQSSAGWTASPFAWVNTSGTGGQQTIKTLNAGSCILSIPYVFGASPYTVTFNALPGTLVKYELLSRAGFSSPDENYCP